MASATNRPPTLNLSDSDLELAGQLLTTFLREYERRISTPDVSTPAIVPDVDRSVLDKLANEHFPDDGIGVERLFKTIGEHVIPNSTAVAHPRFLAYVLGPPTGIAPYADAIAAALNQNCNFWQLSPAASVIERSVVDWLGGLFGFPGTAGGLLTDGGSAATLTALGAALSDRFADHRFADHRTAGRRTADFRTAGLQGRTSPLVLYTSEEAHQAVEKGAVILGVGLDNVRKIPVDADHRMRADLLRTAIRGDRAAGRTPFCVVATAGTVDTGAIDPIDDLADICRDEDLWLHVDGAYGALFVLSEQKRAALAPCGRADSIALDPHKLLFAPLEAGCLIVRDREKLHSAFAFSSTYLTYADDPVMVDFMDCGFQLSRGFKAFKVWCALWTFGVSAFRAALDRTLGLARYLAERVEASTALELMAPVNLTAVCFRVRDADDDAHRGLLAAMAADGTALLGPISIDGRQGLRACVTNYRTTRADIDVIVDRILRTRLA